MYSFFLAACLFPLVAGQYGAPPPSSDSGSSTPTTTSAAAVSAPSAPADTTGHMNIDVAFNGTYKFHPANITASNGTLVTFYFPSISTGIKTMHSVTQSSFANPCTHLAASGNSSAGFDSGLAAAQQFTINITDDSRPIWFHCKQITHCGLGMVGSINAPASGSNTFDAFLAAAMAIGSSETTETDNGPVTGGVGAVATAPPSSGTGSATGSGSASSTSSPSSGSKLAASAGLAFTAGMLAVVLA